MEQKRTLKQAYPDFKTNGVFKQLENYDVVWKNVVSSKVLDLDYYGNHSGNKVVSPLVEMLSDEDTGVLGQEDRNDIAELIFSKFSNAWKKEWDSLMAEYNPLDNFKRTYEEEYGDDKTYNRVLGRDKTDKETGDVMVSRDNTGTQTIEGNDETKSSSTSSSNSTTNNDIYGFDSNSPSNSDVNRNQQNGENNGTTSSDNTTKRTDDLQENVDTNRNLTYTSEEDETDDRTENITGRRRYTSEGNIGVATFQEQLNSELGLRVKWTFFDIVYKNIDDVLTTNIFLI